MSITQLFDAKQAQRENIRSLRGKRLLPLPRRRRKVIFEPLEPRLLLSTNLLYPVLSSVHDFTLKVLPANVLNLIDTNNPSNIEATATLSNPGDSTVNIARSSLGDLNGDTLRLDLDTFSNL